MKYIITENQYNLILESSFTQWVRRRGTQEILMKYILDAEISFLTLCVDFDDEYEYSEEVISSAIDNFLGDYDFDDYTEEPDYHVVRDYLNVLCKELFEERLLEIFRNTCSEE